MANPQSPSSPVQVELSSDKIESKTFKNDDTKSMLRASHKKKIAPRLPVELRAALTITFSGLVLLVVLLAQWIGPAARIGIVMVLGGGVSCIFLSVRNVRYNGLLTYFPSYLRRMLLVVRPIDWLTSRTGLAERIEAVAPFLLRLTPQEVDATLEQMQPEFADALTQPGLLHALPAPVRKVLLPPTTELAISMIEEQIDELTVPKKSRASDRAAVSGENFKMRSAARALASLRDVRSDGADPAPHHFPHAKVSATASRSRRAIGALEDVPISASLHSRDFTSKIRIDRDLFDGNAPPSPFKRHLARVQGYASQLFSKRLSEMVGGRFGKIITSKEFTSRLMRSLSGWPLWTMGIGSATVIVAQLRFSRNGRKVMKEILRKLLLQLSLVGMLTTIAGIAVKRKLRLILDQKENAERSEQVPKNPREDEKKVTVA